MQISRDGQIVDEACGRVVTIDELAVVEDDIETKDNSLEEEEAVWAVVVSGGLENVDSYTGEGAEKVSLSFGIEQSNCPEP